MNRRLFLRMFAWLLVVAMGTFTLSHNLASSLNSSLTRLTPEHQQQLLDYAEQAEYYYQHGQLDNISQLTAKIAAEQGAWSALRASNGTQYSYQALPAHLADTYDFRRKITSPVHTFFTNLVIGIPFKDGGSFVIELPAHMYPQYDVELIRLLLTLVVPTIVLLMFCWFLYRYIMRPIEALNRATIALANGNLYSRASIQLPKSRNDEITQLAGSFDSMADRLQQLITTQRQLLGDLSHELRTPLTRIDLAINRCKETCQQHPEQHHRINHELQRINALIEDALTLAWLNEEPQIANEDNFDLANLLDVIVEDAAFEYQNHRIERHYQHCPIEQGNQRMLAQCIENVLRNALKYSPQHTTVTVSCELDQAHYLLKVCDQGPGVPKANLNDIFKPFYRQDKARSREIDGFGLGLALVKRQMETMGGSVEARNRASGGLEMQLRIPR